MLVPAVVCASAWAVAIVQTVFAEANRLCVWGFEPVCSLRSLKEIEKELMCD